MTKNMKNIIVMIVIDTFYISVTRSKLALLVANNIRGCYVAIRPNFELLCRKWLRDTEHNNHVPAVPARRYSVAGGILFAVDDNVQEFGNDYLPVPPRPPQQQRNPIASNMNNIDDGEDAFVHPESVAPDQIGIAISDIEATESDPLNFNQSVNSVNAGKPREYGQSMDIGDIGDLNNSEGRSGNTSDGSNGGNHRDGEENLPMLSTILSMLSMMNSQNMFYMISDEMIDVRAVQVPESSEVPDEPNDRNHVWIAGPTTYIDPFRRTSGGFALYGRRRSVSVMTTVPEKESQ